MMQLLLNIIEIFFMSAIVLLTFSLSKTLKASGAGMLTDLCWLLEKTPALNTFLIFVIQAIFIATSLICTFGHISNHTIISLDIIYLISSLLLILYHALKEASNPPVKVA